MGELNQVRRSGDDAGLRELLQRVTDLETQLQQVQAASAGFSTMRQEVDFLVNQHYFNSNSGSDYFTVTGASSAYRDFDPSVDASIELDLEVGELCLFEASVTIWSGSATMNANLAVEVLFEGEQIFGDPSPFFYKASGVVPAGGSSTIIHPPVLAGVTAFGAGAGTYTIRTCRQYDVNAATSILFTYPTLTVTRTKRR